MLQTVLYDGTFEGWLCAVFDVYDYKFKDVDIVARDRFGGNLFEQVHEARMDRSHSERLWTGLQKKLTPEATGALYRCFLSEIDGIANTLLQYVQHVFSHEASVEEDFSHPAVLTVTQVARKVWREQHRMEAFVRFKKTADGLYYALVEPDHDVLPLIVKHFESRYADQQWVIYDGRRRYGLHYNGFRTEPVEIQFSEEVATDGVAAVFDPEEAFYQQLWKQYFHSVNIPARKNTKLQLQHMPKRYWKYLVEQQPR